MLALLLERDGEAEELLLCDAICRENVCDCGLAGGNGAGFVKGNDLDTAGFLEACRRFEENAVLCAKAASDHDGNRGRKTQRARAADDEHGNPARKAVAEGLSDEEPHNRGHKCDGDDCRNKNAGDLVGNFRDGRFGGRRVGDHLDDLRERRVLSHAGGATGEKARLIDGCGRNRIAGGLVGGDALAGKCRFIDRACAIKHHAVDRDALAGADDEGVAGLHLLDGDGLFLAAPDDGCGLGCKLHQALERVRRLALRAGLEHLADSDKR